MSRLLELQEQLLKVNASLGELESALVEYPTSPSLVANIKSLHKFRRNLESDFLSVANEVGRDVCHYQLFPGRTLATASALADTLGSFQSAVSVTYDAIKHGPKATRHLSKDILRETELAVAYAYSGSLGIVLTIPNDRLLADIPSRLDEAIHSVFAMVKSPDSSAIGLFARQVGIAPVSALYSWAKANVNHQCGAGIEWRRDAQVRDQLRVQYPELGFLSSAIEATSDEQSINITTSGILVGADTVTRRFHFVVEDTDTDIRGKFGDAISDSQKAELPARYVATMRKTTKTNYSTEQEEILYFLLHLEALPNRD